MMVEIIPAAIIIIGGIILMMMEYKWKVKAPVNYWAVGAGSVILAWGVSILIS